MFDLFKFSILIIIFSLHSCGNNRLEIKKEKSPTPISTNVKIISEPIFSQDQLTPQILGLCVQFKNLRGSNRKAVFEQIEDLLPSCSIAIGEANSSEFDFGSAVQKMSPSDLIELLGDPDEIKKNGAAVYQLEEGNTYNVIFFIDEKGAMACRAIEANS